MPSESRKKPLHHRILGLVLSGDLTAWIVIAIILAVIAALAAPNWSKHLFLGGELFLNLLKMMVVPLVMTSVMSGILGMGDVRRLGRPGGVAIGYYIVTTFLAVILGLIVVNITNPGLGFDEDTKNEMLGKNEVPVDEVKTALLENLKEQSGASDKQIVKLFPKLEVKEATSKALLENLAHMLVPENLFKHMAEMELLPLIVFSIFFAAVLTMMGSSGKPVVDFIQSANDALMRLILIFMKIAPLGIFFLVAGRFGEAQAKGEFVQQLSQIGSYFITVLLGLGIHFFGTLPLIYWLVTKKNPYAFIGKMSQALLTAFSTASSSATLPVTMECAVDKAGVSRRSTKFVLPLGATINMDGTALYEAAAAIFIAQVAGIHLGLGQQAIVAITAALAAIGAAGIPEAGLFTMIIVLNAVGLPLEYMGLILSVDWLLDRFRTATNVCGDSIGAAIVDELAPPKNTSST